MNFIKKSIIRIFKFFKIPVNYSGLRIETLEILKNIIAENEHILKNKEKVENKEYILCFGDSNTFGWNYLYEDSLPVLLGRKVNESKKRKKAVAINLGKGGATIDDLNLSLLNYLKSEKNITAVLSYGLNDALLNNIIKNYFYKNKSNINWDKLDAEDFKEDFGTFAKKYLKILKKFLNKNIKIIIIGLYKVKNSRIENRWVFDAKYLKLQNDILSSYNKKLKELAADNDIFFIDTWNIFDNYFKDEGYIYKDGFHLNNKAYDIVAEKVKDILLKYNSGK